MRFKSKKSVREAMLERFEKEEPYISTHDDADGMVTGLYVADFFSSALGIAEVDIEFPENFGDCDPDANVILDQVPNDPNHNAIVIDHHQQHLGRKGYEYQLYFDTVPTSLIAYDIFRKDIKSEWKVAAGLVGDGQTELIPSHIWDHHPELFHMKASIYQRGSDISVYRNPLYSMLSSGINAISKMQEETLYGPGLGYSVIKQVETPWELVTHSTCEQAKQLQNKEKGRIMFAHAPIDLGKVIFWSIQSKYRMESYMATILESKDKNKKTVVVLNEVNNTIAIRGTHAAWVKSKLPDFQIDGHLKYMGGLLKDDQTSDDLMKALAERLK